MDGCSRVQLSDRLDLCKRGIELVYGVLTVTRCSSPGVPCKGPLFQQVQVLPR